jgi:hypothetical protein
VIGRGDGDRVDVLAVEEAARVVDSLDRETSLGETRDLARENAFVDVADRDQAHVGECAQAIDEVLPAPPHADHRATQGLVRGRAARKSSDARELESGVAGDRALQEPTSRS